MNKLEEGDYMNKNVDKFSAYCWVPPGHKEYVAI